MKKTETPTLSNQKFIMIIVGLMALNLLCINIISKRTSAVNLDGTYAAANSSGLMFSAVLGFMVSLPLLIALVAAFFSLFINKQIPYGKRFLRLFLWMLSVFYVVTLIRFVLVLFS